MRDRDTTPVNFLKFTCKILYSGASWNDNMGCNFIYDPKEHGVCAAVFWLSQISQIKGGPWPNGKYTTARQGQEYKNVLILSGQSAKIRTNRDKLKN
jgi:hypothetical protein